MLKRKMFNSFFAFALVAALVMAGCGGGGGGSNGTPPEMAGPGTPPEMAGPTDAEKITAAQGAAKTAYEAAKAALAAVEANKDVDLASHTRASDAVDDAEAANEMAKAATTADAAETAQGDVEDARDNAVKYAGMVTMAKMDAMDAKMAADALAAANKVAMTKKTAIMTEETETPGDSSGGFDDTDSAYTLMIEHKDGAVKTTITDPALPDENDPKFMQSGMMNTRTRSGMTEVVVVHTDIEAPDAVPFGGTDSGYSLTEDIDDTTTALDTYVVLLEDATKLGGSAIVPTKGSAGTKILTLYDAATEAGKKTYRGSLAEVPGTFRCNAGTCTVTRADDADGTLTITGGGTIWFTPDRGATVDVDDDDYLHYGLWVKKTVKEGVTTSYDAVQTFAGSNLSVADVSDIEGTATYEGNAAGVYTHDTLDESGDVDVSGAGTFTADVALTASFGGFSVAQDDFDTIKGTVSRFELSGGQANNWKLDLPSAAIQPADGTFGATTDVVWSGSLHQPDNHPDDEAPTVAVGEFNGSFVNGKVAGAFGARKMEE